MNTHKNQNRCGLVRASHRTGISLIEVIACTAIVTVLIVPIAGIVKISGRAIKRVETDTTTAQELRSASSWIRDTLRLSHLLKIDKNYLKLQLPSGTIATVLRQGSELVMDDGSNLSVICEGIDDVWFQELLTSSKPTKRVGLSMTITARDPVTGVASKIQTTVANSL